MPELRPAAAAAAAAVSCRVPVRRARRLRCPGRILTSAHVNEVIHLHILRIAFLRPSVVLSAQIDLKHSVGLVEDGGVEHIPDIHGYPTNPDPHNWCSASAGSLRAMASAGPSGALVNERAPSIRLALLTSGQVMGGAGLTGYEGLAPTGAQTAMGRTMEFARTGSTLVTAIPSRHSPSPSTSFAGGGYRPGLSGTSSLGRQLSILLE